jgi:sulfur-oxidizing protein SoxY
MRRRGFLARIVALSTSPLALLPTQRAQAQDALDAIVPAIRDTVKDAAVKPGKIKLQIPRLADNGNSVAVKLTVESPMTQSDFVRGIYLFSEKNPRPVIARFHFVPESGRAEVTTRIRLAGTQRVVAIAELSDGSFWSDVAEVAVTLSACLDGT